MICFRTRHTAVPPRVRVPGAVRTCRCEGPGRLPPRRLRFGAAAAAAWQSRTCSSALRSRANNAGVDGSAGSPGPPRFYFAGRFVAGDSPDPGPGIESLREPEKERRREGRGGGDSERSECENEKKEGARERASESRACGRAGSCGRREGLAGPPDRPADDALPAAGRRRPECGRMNDTTASAVVSCRPDRVRPAGPGAVGRAGCDSGPRGCLGMPGDCCGRADAGTPPAAVGGGSRRRRVLVEDRACVSLGLDGYMGGREFLRTRKH